MIRSLVAFALALTLWAGGPGSAGAASPSSEPTVAPSAAASTAPTAAAPVSPAPVQSGESKNANLAQFITEAAAQTHCPKDEVVWLNLRNDVYFAKDSTWYGKAKRGAYVCRKEADASGDRVSPFDPMTRHKAEY